MKKDSRALNFSEKERVCESIFINNGPYWHVYTDGTMMQNIFISKEDFIIGMWCLAAARYLCKSVRIITFELMGNHVHLILAGAKDRHSPSHALWLQCNQPAAQKNAPDGSGSVGGTLPLTSHLSRIHCSQQHGDTRVCGRRLVHEIAGH